MLKIINLWCFKRVVEVFSFLFSAHIRSVLEIFPECNRKGLFVQSFTTLCRKLCLFQSNNIYFLRATKIRTRRDSQSLWLRKHAGSVNMSCLVLCNRSLTLNKLRVLKQNHKTPNITVFNYHPAPDIARHVYITKTDLRHIFFRLTEWFLCINTTRE